MPRSALHARAQSSAIDLVEALLVEAMVLAQQGRWAEAEQSLEEGLDLARRMPYPYAEARLLHLYGEMHAQKGESEPARERLEAALALFRRLGARKDVERVAQALSTVPSVPPRAAAGPARPSLPTRPGVRAGAPAGRCLARRERHAWALEHLRTVGPLSPRAYATALAVSIDTALLDLRDLVARGLVRAEGRTKNRRYVLTGTDQP